MNIVNVRPNEPRKCECGCGFYTHVIRYTDRKKGRVKGEYARYLPGHRGKTAEEGYAYELSYHYRPDRGEEFAYWKPTIDRYGNRSD